MPNFLLIQDNRYFIGISYVTREFQTGIGH